MTRAFLPACTAQERPGGLTGAPGKRATSLEVALLLWHEWLAAGSNDGRV